MAAAVSLSDMDWRKRAQVMALLGAGAQVGILLPYSRSQESEADHIGLLLMARAGYNPIEAVEFWQRMEKLGGRGGPEFLSTHPSHGRRIAQLREWLPEARQIYANTRPHQPDPSPRLPLSR
jgi:predicted Zn-dependent protease